MLTDLLPAWPYITLARTASRRAGYLSLTSPLLWLSQPCHSLAASASQQASRSRRTTSIHLHGVLRLQRSTRPDNRISLFPIRPSLDPLSLLPIPSCEVVVGPRLRQHGAGSIFSSITAALEPLLHSLSAFLALPQVHQSRVQSRACRSWLVSGSTTLPFYDVAFSPLRGIVQFFGASFAAILPPPSHSRLPGDSLTLFIT